MKLRATVSSPEDVRIYTDFNDPAGELDIEFTEGRRGMPRFPFECGYLVQLHVRV
jgi:hypothetical protein